jgi:hypothetical protein
MFLNRNGERYYFFLQQYVVLHILMHICILKIFLGWLRTDEENVKMREAKLVNKPAKQNAELDEQRSSSPDSASQNTSPYQPRFENILVYLMPEDVKFLEKIVDDYWKAYK